MRFTQSKTNFGATLAKERRVFPSRTEGQEKVGFMPPPLRNAESRGGLNTLTHTLPPPPPPAPTHTHTHTLSRNRCKTNTGSGFLRKENRNKNPSWEQHLHQHTYTTTRVLSCQVPHTSSHPLQPGGPEAAAEKQSGMPKKSEIFPFLGKRRTRKCFFQEQLLLRGTLAHTHTQPRARAHAHFPQCFENTQKCPEKRFTAPRSSSLEAVQGSLAEGPAG